ncbi:MAG TPA: hydrogenase maturation protease [Rhizomicrobium sp.]|jgi:hydrogenase maturation protease|nr:hydrogenase maturation protease [Rhizomicrobium sp.]
MTILIAGIGNIFQGDDAFGVEIAQRLLSASLPPDVKVVDFGIRGIDLTYALMDGHDVAILVDAAARGEAPGTLSLVECDRPATTPLDAPIVSAHDLDPAKVMQLVQTLGGNCRRILLVACEPGDCGGEEGHMGLTPPVAAAIEPAVEMIHTLLAELRQGEARAAA